MKSKIISIFFILLSLSLLISFTGCNNTDGDHDTRIDPCSVCDSGTYSRTVITPAKMLSDGEVKLTCSSCGDSRTETIPATKSFKLLVVGDASSADAVKHLEPMLKELGVENIIISQLNHDFSAGASLDSQWNNIQNNSPVYTIPTTINGVTDREYSMTFADGLRAYDWDYILLQQCVADAGAKESYGNLSNIINYISENKTNSEAEIYWNMTWAFSESCVNEGFLQYGYDQITMYEAICDTLEEKVLTESRISGIVPVGTALQNLRETHSVNELISKEIKLDNGADSYSTYLASLAICHALTGIELSEISWTPEYKSSFERNIYSLIKEAVGNAMNNKLCVNAPKAKSIKLLIFGNSSGHDATRYLEKILNDGGYVNVTIGHVGESAMAINDHYHNIDDDPDNDYIYTNSSGESYTFSVHYKTVNGTRVDLPADYKQIVADEPWDYILFYQGPNNIDTLTQAAYYSELDNFVSALKANMTNHDSKIVYYMPWAHNVSDTTGLYNGICDITKELIVTNSDIVGVIPAATMIQNLRSSYLKDGAGGDITRDWGHLNYGVGRYALGLLFYAYLTGGDIEDVEYIPTKNDISGAEKEHFTDPGANIDVIYEAVKNALDTPFSVTESIYKEKP